MNQINKNWLLFCMLVTLFSRSASSAMTVEDKDGIETPSSVVSNLFAAMEKSTDDKWLTYVMHSAESEESQFIQGCRSMQPEFLAHNIGCKVIGSHVISNCAVVVCNISSRTQSKSNPTPLYLIKRAQSWLLLPDADNFHGSGNTRYTEGLEAAGLALENASKILSTQKQIYTLDPEPIWKMEQTAPAVGQPQISPNGQWLLIMQEGDWFRQGECLMLVDLAARKVVQNQRLSPIGIIGKPNFDPSSDSIRAVVNTEGGCSLATWTIPDMKVSIKRLAFGRAVSATWSHKQDKAVIMREDGVIAVFDVGNGGKLLEVNFHKAEKRNAPQSMAISWDDKVVTSGVLDHKLCSWRIADGTSLDTRPEADISWGYPVEYTADNTKLLIPAWHWFLISDATNGKAIFKFDANGLRSLSYDPHRNLVAAPIGDGETFGVVDTSTGQLIMSARHDRGTSTTSGDVSWACLAPDGKTVYSGGFFSIKAWNLGEALAKYKEANKP